MLLFLVLDFNLLHAFFYLDLNVELRPPKKYKKVPQNIDFVGLVFLLLPFGFSFGDPLGGGTLYFLSLIISYLSCCLSFSPPISPRLNFFVLH